MIKKNDFIELDFTAKIKETGNVFDTTLMEEAKKAGLPADAEEIKPLKICVGQEMVVSGLDKALEGKETGKSYAVELKPREAFGERNAKLVRIVPVKAFIEKDIAPVRGMMLTLDGMLARIVSVSGGRVVVDFNNPLAGKVIEYNFTIKRQITQTEEKLAVLANFYLREKPTIKLNEKNEKEAEVEIKGVPRKIHDTFVKKAQELLGISATLKTKKEGEQKEAKEAKQTEEKKEEKQTEEKEKEKKEENKEKKEEEEEENVKKKKEAKQL